MRLGSPAAILVVMSAAPLAHADGAAVQLVDGCAGRLRGDFAMLGIALGDYTSAKDSLSRTEEIMDKLAESKRTGAHTWLWRLGDLTTFEAERKVAFAKKEKRLRELKTLVNEIRARRARLERLLVALDKSPWAKRPPRDQEAADVRARGVTTLEGVQPALQRVIERAPEAVK